MDSAACFYIFMHLYTYLTITLKSKEDFKLRETERSTREEVGKGNMGGIREKKGKGKWCNYILSIILYLKKRPFPPSISS